MRYRLRRATLVGVGLYIAWRRRAELLELAESARQWLAESSSPPPSALPAAPPPAPLHGSNLVRPMKRATLFVGAAVRIQRTWRKLHPVQLKPDDERALHSRLVSAHTGLSGRMEMDVSLNIMSCHAIDTVEQQFSCEFVLRVRTLNAASLRTAERDERVTHENWEPRIRILNLISIERWRMRPATLGPDAPQGEIDFKYTISGVLAEPFQLALFPFDTQVIAFQSPSILPPDPPTAGQSLCRRPIACRMHSPALTCSSLALPPHFWQTLTLTLSSAIPRHCIRFHARGHESARRIDPWPAVHAPWAVVPDAARFSAGNVFLMSQTIHHEEGYTSRSTSGTERPWLKLSMAVRRLPGYYVSTSTRSARSRNAAAHSRG